MTKQEIRAKLSMLFLEESKNLLSKDPELQSIIVYIKLVDNPDLEKTGTFTINLLKK
ncbi:hypothetical protein KO504_09080 [Winogradskyella psychrotolerans]|uniref:hypothetical protein n=1 Tax=Winogradskyella psychrotolerans TaxID=1344585 RepID=UPI001C07C3ED|nr:hypothetical protein [Winogradskyella psychrotolerans]MBU2921492.1 hypothetical protein [Winogradskyella psychrotolerans]